MIKLFAKYGSIYDTSESLYRKDFALYLANLINNRAVQVARDKKKYGYAILNDTLIYLAYSEMNLFSSVIVFHIDPGKQEFEDLITYISENVRQLGIDIDKISEYKKMVRSRISLYVGQYENDSRKAYDMQISNLNNTLKNINGERILSLILQSYIEYFDNVKKQFA